MGLNLGRRGCVRLHCEQGGANVTSTAADRRLVHQLHDSGIRRMVVGHTPHGNCPTVIKCKADDAFVDVIMADTSYSGRTSLC